MKRLLTILLLAGALLLLGAANAWASAPLFEPTLVASFDQYPAFAESLTVDPAGDLLVSVTRWGDVASSGEVWRLGPGGERTLVASLDVGPGLQTGIACDGAGRVYVAVATFSSAPSPGVYRVAADGTATRVMTLPADSFPNGIAIHDGAVWVSDCARGAIWRMPLASSDSPSAPWFRNALLKPSMNGLGVNGLAFRQDKLFMAVSDSGRIFSVGVRADGSAGALTTIIHAKALRSADGIAFDARGGLWITTNHAAGALEGPSGGLYRLSPSGVLQTIATNPGWLDYPTQAVFGTTGATRTTMYIANGSFELGVPNVISVDAGISGLPLD